MANADGSVIFSCDLDSTKAQKKLSKLRDEISELNSKLEKETGNKMNLEKQLDAASKAAKATEERVMMLRKDPIHRLLYSPGFLRRCRYRLFQRHLTASASLLIRLNTETYIQSVNPINAMYKSNYKL